MASIYDISGLSPEVDKNNRKKAGQVNQDRLIKKSKVNLINSGNVKDKAVISDESVKLFNLQKESKQYLEMVKKVHLVSEKQLQELKENVLNDFYSDHVVLDTIVTKMLSMTNYKN